MMEKFIIGVQFQTSNYFFIFYFLFFYLFFIQKKNKINSTVTSSILTYTMEKPVLEISCGFYFAIFRTENQIFGVVTSFF